MNKPANRINLGWSEYFAKHGGRYLQNNVPKRRKANRVRNKRTRAMKQAQRP